MLWTNISRWVGVDSIAVSLFTIHYSLLTIDYSLLVNKETAMLSRWVACSFEACKLISKPKEKDFFAQGVFLVGNLINQMWTNSSFEMAK